MIFFIEFTASFPPEYTGALMNGQGLSGLIVALLSLLTSLAGSEIDVCEDDANNDDSCESSISYSTLAYFLIATFVLVSCIGLFIVLMKLSITK